MKQSPTLKVSIGLSVLAAIGLTLAGCTSPAPVQPTPTVPSAPATQPSQPVQATDPNQPIQPTQPKPTQPATQPKPTQPKTSQAMDLAAINTGDTTSIAGLWKNAGGSTLNVTGQYVDGYLPQQQGPTTGSYAKWGQGTLAKGVLIVWYENYSGAGTGALIFVPKGIFLPDANLQPGVATMDSSDETRDRIFIASGAGPWVSFPDQEAFYLVT